MQSSILPTLSPSEVEECQRQHKEWLRTHKKYAGGIFRAPSPSTLPLPPDYQKVDASGNGPSLEDDHLDSGYNSDSTADSCPVSPALSTSTTATFIQSSSPDANFESSSYFSPPTLPPFTETPDSPTDHASPDQLPADKCPFTVFAAFLKAAKDKRAGPPKPKKADLRAAAVAKARAICTAGPSQSSHESKRNSNWRVRQNLPVAASHFQTDKPTTAFSTEAIPEAGQQTQITAPAESEKQAPELATATLAVEPMLNSQQSQAAQSTEALDLADPLKAAISEDTTESKESEIQAEANKDGIPAEAPEINSQESQNPLPAESAKPQDNSKRAIPTKDTRSAESAKQEITPKPAIPTKPILLKGQQTPPITPPPSTNPSTATTPAFPTTLAPIPSQSWRSKSSPANAGVVQMSEGARSSLAATRERIQQRKEAAGMPAFQGPLDKGGDRFGGKRLGSGERFGEVTGLKTWRRV